jgi:hypothetical protein
MESDPRSMTDGGRGECFGGVSIGPDFVGGCKRKQQETMNNE